MLKGIIINQFTKVVEETAEVYSDKYRSDVKLILIPLRDSARVRITILSEKYTPLENISISDLKIPIVSSSIVENKILQSIDNLAEQYNLADPAILLVPRYHDVRAFLYDGKKNICKLELQKLL